MQETFEAMGGIPVTQPFLAKNQIFVFEGEKFKITVLIEISKNKLSQLHNI